MLSPKQIGTICFTISILISAPLFATDISSSASTADCKYSPLQVYSGTSNLEAGWTANEISLYWYNNNTLMEVDNASSDCTYDSTLTPPSTIPTRTGYTFTGWKVRPTYDFATLNTSTDGAEHWAIGLSGTSDNCVHANNIAAGSSTVSCTAYPEYYKEIQRYEWKVHFTWGDIYGSSYCSAKSGNNNSNAWNNDSSNWLATYGEISSASGTKQYCWCQATGYKPTGDNTIYGPTSVSAGSSWVFGFNYLMEDRCTSGCAALCSGRLWNTPAFRRAVFGVSQ